MDFCARLGIDPTPASSAQLCMYAAWLARKYKFNSIKPYLNAVRLAHLEEELPNPMLKNYHLESTLRGIRRALGDQVMRKLPITPNLLRSVLDFIDLSLPLHSAFWAACLVMFFGLLRRSNTLYDSTQARAGKFLKKNHVELTRDGVLIKLPWSKTIQFGSRVLTIPLPRIRGHCLCPTQAVAHHFQTSPSEDPDLHAFAYIHQGHPTPLTPQVFIKLLRSALTPSVEDPKSYAGHSFRRGGAVWAFYSGVEVEAIRLLGDWKSDSYRVYLDSSPARLAHATSTMASMQGF